MIYYMVEEDYVSFETAKLLKEKGFKEPVTELFREGERPVLKITLQNAMKWLREVHNIHIVVYPYTDKEGHNWSFIFDKYAYGCWQELGIYITDSWSSYEEASEVAIKYCLENLI